MSEKDVETELPMKVAVEKVVVVFLCMLYDVAPGDPVHSMRTLSQNVSSLAVNPVTAAGAAFLNPSSPLENPDCPVMSDAFTQYQ